MLYNYKALDTTGAKKEGSIEAVTLDVAVDALQKRGLIIANIEPANKEAWYDNITLGSKIKNKDIVMLSRQMATLFEAQVSALKIFTLLGAEIENKYLRKVLSEVSEDLQGGSTISKALSMHPDVFTDFYVNMVKAGEETGKLDSTFEYLADYLERNYEVVSKAKNALIYPAFVITVFIAVMILMFVVIIPKISVILTDSTTPIPTYTAVVFALSHFFVHYGAITGAALVVAVFFLIRYVRTPEGKATWAHFKLDIPFIGNLYTKLYLSIISDNMNTMVRSGIPMARAIEITAAVVDNEVYKNILNNALVAVKSGSSLSQALSQYEEMPSLLVQMMRVGEETGELGEILQTMAHFYQREVVSTVDTLVGLIEPIMIVALGLGVGTLLASVLIPIYNIAGAS